VAFTSEDRVRDVIRNFNADGFGSLSVRPRAGPHPGPLRLPSRVDLRAETEVEADRLEDVERGAVCVDVGRLP